MTELKELCKKNILAYIFVFATLMIFFKIFIPSSLTNKFFLASILFKAMLVVGVIIILNKNVFINVEFYRNKLLLPICLVFLVFSLIHAHRLVNLQSSPVSNVRFILYFIHCLITGFYEEFLFRLLIFGMVSAYLLSLHKQSIFKSVFFSSLIFALCHLTNLFDINYDYIGVFNQVLFAFLIGFVLQSIYLKCRNIFVVAIFHAIINFTGTFNSKLLLTTHSSIPEINLNQVCNTLLTFIAFGIVIVLPISLYCLRGTKNNVVNMETIKMYLK